jgi:hypothetical protein
MQNSLNWLKNRHFQTKVTKTLKYRTYEIYHLYVWMSSFKLLFFMPNFDLYPKYFRNECPSPWAMEMGQKVLSQGLKNGRAYWCAFALSNSIFISNRLKDSWSVKRFQLPTGLFIELKSTFSEALMWNLSMRNKSKNGLPVWKDSLLVYWQVRCKEKLMEQYKMYSW